MEIKYETEADLQKKLKEMEEERDLLMEIKDEQEKTILEIEEEMKMICKYTELDEKKHKKGRKRFSLQR